ncbi:hybrid nucleoside-diphosphate sugar epimerase/sugar transferase [Devosia rhizoryzae]|uniref:Sugar transferase n=1 Tax=Devosia rhizoryzae TaxID=2774137 RepID=A0ABX7C2C9_9HYPH|nr:hybrid nucleoside-diphosphate sugar epimerase/sugar transferase [Devosia rhizoryzae]QQR38389.1 sugar transferase [Devosia rhizoryzae]
MVTGATGRLGQQLVPHLESRGALVIVVGRNVAKLRSIFPGRRACTYEELQSSATGAHLVVHLAVLNNDVDAPLSEFERINVGLAMQVAEAAKSAQVGRMINVSSTHALDEKNQSKYARTKREAVEKLGRIPSLAVTNFFLPAVISSELSGKLSALNNLPPGLRLHALMAVSALKPTVRVATIADQVLSILSFEDPDDRIVSEGQQRNPYYHLGKRVIDLTFAVGVLVCLWWLLVALWVAIALQSKGPAIFAQVRVGRGGRMFTCYKFRTMHQGTPNVGTHDAPQNAVTPIGRFLRSSKLDELPQIFNILLNQVSLIGPRPCLPSQTVLIAERARRGVLEVKPGISGYSQVQGVDMSEPERLAIWDEKYLRLQSLLLDINIILSTARGGGQGDRTKKHS